MAFELRSLRRQYGLTQVQLAELVGQNQSTISRWESGREEIKPSLQLELLDLFSNRGGKLDPLVKRLFERANNLTAFDFNLKCLACADLPITAAKMEKSEVLGRDYSELCKSEWFSFVYGDVPIEERLYFEYEHRLAFQSLAGESVPVHTKQYFVQFEDSPGIMLSLVNPAPPLDGPRLIQQIATDSLDVTG